MLDSRERASCHKERDPDLIRGIGQRERERGRITRRKSEDGGAFIVRK